jgi:hypothetical protein
VRYEPGVDPLLEPDVGGAPDPDGGVPDGAFEFEPLPMFGQFFVEPEFEEPESVLPVLELDDGVVEDELDVEGFDVELEPVFPELPVVDVVAASATSAPPATRPDVSAPMARTLRKRICMGGCPFLSLSTGPVEPVVIRCAPDLSAAAEGRGRVRGVT